MKLSIIIPTLNEERYLPLLLRSIKKQKVKAEVIVADGGSKDKTVEIARKVRCKTVKGGKNPAQSRNKGAAKASGDILLFLDADTILPRGFLKESLEEFEERGLGVASCYPSLTGKIKALNELFSVSFKIIAGTFQHFNLFPTDSAYCIFSRKSIHRKLWGFDEKIALWEGADYMTRASKICECRFLKRKKIFNSIRRFEKEPKILIKWIYVILYWLFKGKTKKQIVRYEFGKF